MLGVFREAELHHESESSSAVLCVCLALDLLKNKCFISIIPCLEGLTVPYDAAIMIWSQTQSFQTRIRLFLVELKMF